MMIAFVLGVGAVDDVDVDVGVVADVDVDVDVAVDIGVGAEDMHIGAEEGKEAIGIKVCVVKACLSKTLTSKINRPSDDEGRRVRGKQEKRLRDGVAGAPLGEVW